MIKQWEDPFFGQPLTLLDFQHFILANLFGWTVKETGLNRFRFAYIQVARKAGKSVLAAAIALYWSITARGAQILLAANSRKQIQILYRHITKFAESITGGDGKVFESLKNEIRVKPTDSIILPLSAEAGIADGYSPNLFIIDELAAAPNADMLNVMRSGQGTKSLTRCLGVCITTAGYNLESPAYKIRCTQTEVLQGLKEEESTFSYIAELDEGDDWTDMSLYKKANPAIGHTLSEGFYTEELQRAKNSTVSRTEFLIKNLNIWQSSDQSVFELADIEANLQDFDMTQFTEDNGWVCYAGADLAMSDDLCAQSWTWYNTEESPKERQYYSYIRYYMPKESLKKSPDRQYFEELARQKDKFGEPYLVLTEGNICDLERLLVDMGQFAEKYFIRSLGVDPYNASQYSFEAQ